MPYVKPEERINEEKIKELLDGLNLETAGNLNYTITSIVHLYLKKHGLRYSVINDCVGALEGAKLEFYRRVAAPYEDEKIKENGDVMPDVKSGSKY